MKFFYSRAFLLGTIIFSNFFLQAVSVRVLLDEQNAGEWHLRSSRGFVFKDPSTNKVIAGRSIAHEVTIVCSEDTMMVNNTIVVKDTLLIIPLQETTCIGNHVYEGIFCLKKEGDSCLLVNVVDIESYVCSVLKTEGFPGWPLEMNKVMAIAIRSYALYKVVDARKNGRQYHLKNSNKDQTYKGTHQDLVLCQAVEETTGIFLAHKGKPILAMYDCCCGGVIPAKIHGKVDFKEAPYLARKKACTFCKGASAYQWQRSYTLDELTTHFQEKLSSPFAQVKGLKVVTRDKAGLAKKNCNTHQTGVDSFDHE